MSLEEPSGEKYGALQKGIEEFIETSRQIGIMVTDFQPGCQGVLNTKINSLVESMCDIEKNKALVADVSVPPELFAYIDQGRNPQLYTKDCLKRTLVKQGEVNGKTQAYKKFRNTLVDELKKELPQTMEKHAQFKKQQYKQK